MLLQNKIIFITGGSNGIGAECSKAYIKEGATLAVISNNTDELAQMANQVGDKHLMVDCDVSNEQQVQMAIEKTIARFGKIDGIHNNAGIASPSKPIHTTFSNEWDLLMNTNIKSMYLTAKYGFSYLEKSKGCILNTSSLVAEIGQENHAAYSATKGAVNALTKSMALDYAKYSIRVNAVSPAGVWTPMLRKWASEQPNPNDIENYLDKIHPLGYCPSGDVIADACVFLLSEKARFITGCILPVSGGAELGYKL